MERQYGEHPGSYESIVDYLQSCSETELFLLIKDKHGYINFLLDDARESGDEGYQASVGMQLVNEQYALDFAIMQTQRFGVEVVEPSNNQRVQKNEFFKIWYKQKFDELKNDSLEMNEVKKANQIIKMLSLK